MLDTRLTRRGALSLAAALAGTVVVAEPSWPSPATPDDAVQTWIERHAVPLPSTDAARPVDDLRPLRGSVERAQVVGLGESAHGTHEQFTLKHRAARFLVERMGFRTLAWEESWGSGVAIDRFVTTGAGDPGAVVAAASSVWRSADMLDLVHWMRTYNLTHQDKIRFVGTDLTQLQQLLFDEIVEYVGDVAPQRLNELADALDPIRLRGLPEEHIMWYLQQPDKQPYIDHARAVYELVIGLPLGPSRIDREYPIQHARVILGFYEYYATGVLDQRDRFMADTLIWWQQRSQHRIIYWAANVHTAASPQVTYSLPPFVPPTPAVVAGSHLRQRYGRRYVSVGTVFHTGEVL